MARKILLADDSVTAQNMGRRILSDAGYEVTTVNNGSAALKKISESKPDLIVLDVYMPGYGGLEVCQRLRESDDTARIPVLLTVGKLEPFKVEEVRRVRADAFIIKPFEASELLTALTKLEDRIVPVAAARKPGRNPKPGASVDEFMGTDRSYGDTETGWKNRLRIPPPHHKSHREPSEPEIERFGDAEPAPEQKREHAHPEPEKKEIKRAEVSAKKVEKPVAEARVLGLPTDITAEELAALQAAAEAFRKPLEAAKAPEVEKAPEARTEEPKEKPGAETEVTTTAPSAEVRGDAAPSTPDGSAPAAEPPAGVAEIAASPTASEASAPAKANDVPEVAASSPPEQQPASPVTPEQKTLAEHEVAAVLASLEFVNGTNASDAEPDEPLFATIAAAPAKEEVSGPRWVASSVPVSQEEAALILEEEMQKALAAMAQLQSAETSVPEPASAVTESLEQTQQSAACEVPEAKVEEAVVPAAENSAVEQLSALQPTEAVAASATPESVEAPQKAAYAAAASMGSGISETTVSTEAVSALVTPDAAPAAETTQPRQDSELASAWASWKQIRESVVSPQSTPQIAEAAASALSTESASAETSSVEPAHAESAKPEVTAAEPEAAAGEDSEAIANIVDSVLSELKPKLMKEIAKKMGKEKRRK
ncbi:MAG TPA: response regulator [Terriglobales bacterium]|nr:response regulator [Terriglobales bacterium]